MKNIPFEQVVLTDGFWAQRQQTNRTVTEACVYDRFAETGRVDAFRCDWKPDMPNEPHIFWDSDIAKWMEGAAYLLAQQPDAQLEAKVEALIDQIEANQHEDGYFNIYYTVVKPSERFTVRANHELYCAGHLIEAAVAYAKATGKRRFLNCMIRYAELIDRVFRVEHSAAFTTPGHQEIELALVKLADFTGERRWLTLAQWFIEMRGVAENDDHSRHNQTHLPVRRQFTAEGHSVRACYMYSAMADLAVRCNDPELADTCRALFDNIVRKRMYVTGGVGSSVVQEAFTVDYDLPNVTAYTESCAAIALAMFARRMQLLEPDVRYADVIERILYNGFLSSVSLDGKAFFYSNPLEILPEHTHRNVSSATGGRGEWFPRAERSEVFTCSCCPPNILRFMAGLGGMLYSVDDSTRTVYCHQYMASRAEFELCGEKATLTQETAYPVNGHIRFTWHGPSAVLKLRVPHWVRDFAGTVENGYVTYSVADGHVIELDFPMEIRFMAANPRVQFNAGRCAVTRGPLLYCLEAPDNGTNLRDLRLCANGAWETVQNDQYGVPVLTCNAVRCAPSNELYYDLRDVIYEPCRAVLIPYFAFANRGENEMVVWTLVQ